MAYRLVLDENVEHEVRHRLQNYGHDAVHVEEVSDLGKAAPTALSPGTHERLTDSS
jgi:hypothetical protein